jgi:hypothetical protein
MKNNLLFILLLIISTTVFSQTDAGKYYLTNANQRFGFSAIEFRDPYISILDYVGLGMTYENDATRFFKSDDPVLSHTGRISGILGLTVNPESTASVMYMGADASWGVQYHYREFEDFLLLGGANINGDLRYKMNSRNVNNPISIGASTNLNLTLGGKYFLHTRKRVMQLNFIWEAPVIGCMFVIPQGMTIYELSKNPDLSKVLHLTHLQNKQGLKQHYSMEIPFRHATWTFGFDVDKLKYQADEQIYSIRETGFFVGVSYDLYKFAGRRIQAPGNFISPDF